MVTSNVVPPQFRADAAAFAARTVACGHVGLSVLNSPSCGSRCPGTINLDLATNGSSRFDCLFVRSIRSGARNMLARGIFSASSGVTRCTTPFLIHSDHSFLSEMSKAACSFSSKKVGSNSFPHFLSLRIKASDVSRSLISSVHKDSNSWASCGLKSAL